MMEIFVSLSPNMAFLPLPPFFLVGPPLDFQEVKNHDFGNWIRSFIVDEDNVLMANMSYREKTG